VSPTERLIIDALVIVTPAVSSDATLLDVQVPRCRRN
jgi:hypothetical protein